jgi:hypothetical protein
MTRRACTEIYFLSDDLCPRGCPNRRVACLVEGVRVAGCRPRDCPNGGRCTPHAYVCVHVQMHVHVYARVCVCAWKLSILCMLLPPKGLSQRWQVHASCVRVCACASACAGVCACELAAQGIVPTAAGARLMRTFVCMCRCMCMCMRV